NLFLRLARRILSIAERGYRDSDISKKLSALVYPGTSDAIPASGARISLACDRNHETYRRHLRIYRHHKHHPGALPHFWNWTISAARGNRGSTRDVHFDRDREHPDGYLLLSELSISALSLFPVFTAGKDVVGDASCRSASRRRVCPHGR